MTFSAGGACFRCAAMATMISNGKTRLWRYGKRLVLMIVFGENLSGVDALIAEQVEKLIDALSDEG